MKVVFYTSFRRFIGLVAIIWILAGCTSTAIVVGSGATAAGYKFVVEASCMGYCAKSKTPSSKPESPELNAAMNNDAAKIRMLIEQNPEIKTDSKRLYPLLRYAAKNGAHEVILLFIPNVIDVNHPLENDLTMFDYAMMVGNCRTANFLVEHGASAFGISPMHKIAEAGNWPADVEFCNQLAKNVLATGLHPTQQDINEAFTLATKHPINQPMIELLQSLGGAKFQNDSSKD